VASCGTAFGDEHISVLRRYLLDAEVIRGEVVYTFDGDSAGQKAAIKAFESDQKFAANTYVAVAPAGMDPCELRQAKGDEAVRALVDNRTPLFAFAITTTLQQYNLDTAEGRVAATNATVPLVAGIKEATLRDEYIRQLAGWLGSELDPIRGRVREFEAAAAREAKRTATRASAGQRGVAAEPAAGHRNGGPPDRRPPANGARRAGGEHAPPPEPPEPPDDEAPDEDAPPDDTVPAGPAVSFHRPHPKNPALRVEREALQLALQHPDLVVAGYPHVSEEAYTDSTYAAVHRAIAAAGGPPGDGSKAAWVDVVAEQLPSGGFRSLFTELAVEPPPVPPDAVNARYAGAILARMAERVAAAEERNLRSAMQRAEASGDSGLVLRLHADLVAVANYRRALADRARGDT
jgi:DNA primase